MTTTSDCITYSRHTEQHDGQDIQVERWGTEHAYLERTNDDPHIYLCIDERNTRGEHRGNPLSSLVSLSDLRELHQVLGWFLMNYTHQGESLTLADVQAMNPAALLGREVQR